MAGVALFSSQQTSADSPASSPNAPAPGTPIAAQAASVDAEIQPYQKASGVSGNLSSVGSDTLNNLMTLWAEGFKGQYPGVKIQVEGKGSGTAPPALIAGTSQIGPMSRAMKPSEIDDFEKKFGYKPTQIRVALDSLAVFVNKDNPLEQLTLTQVDAIFSKGRKRGSTNDAKTWGDLGLTGNWAARPLSLYGRNSASGTYGFFKEHVLAGGDYKDTVKEQPGSAAVVQSVGADMNGVGYSGIGYRTPDVKTLRLAEKEGAPFVPTDAEQVYAGKYPLSRFLYLYINKAPNKALDPLVREFVSFVLSHEGQETVVKDGFLPLKSKTWQEELSKIRPIQ
ncbi:MAG: PstS family phosphate ABC transporter substrate-binding protein [Planctomycetes bacterium]|nr:PstS family phosphate ABC transporter substrate-binding protein [Planctomycetota bacterium]MBI3843645.1 PstS family phosphate ABC transporter substrate-binding protein [Planctomycetota bacterium]